MRPTVLAAAVAAVLLAPLTSHAQAPRSERALGIVSVTPEGEIAELAQANSVTVVFSEPMVVLGRIPSGVRPDFFRITPAVEGTFRWSGTTILIFTPDPKRPLPHATTFDVTIDARATAVSGRRLGRPRTFRFTTPTVRLLRTQWYRRGDTVDGAIVALLRFNQPVRPGDVAAHLSASLQKHDLSVPAPTPQDLARMRAADPRSPDLFAAKVKASQAVAASEAPVPVRLTGDWDRKRFPPAPDLVAIETTARVLPASWVKLTIDDRIPSPAGKATPASPQTFTIRAEEPFLIWGFECARACDPGRGNGVNTRVPVKVAAFAQHVSVMDVTDAAAPRPVARPATPAARRERGDDESQYLRLEDAGFEAQPPMRTYDVTVSPSLRAADGQVLGYTWVGRVENWHLRAFTSFGDGHGVWETGGGPLLPFYARNFQGVTQWAHRLLPTDLVPTVLRLQKEGEPEAYDKRFSEAPPGQGITRRLGGTADRIESHGLDLSPALGVTGAGLVWAAVQEGKPIDRAPADGESRVRATVVQVTNLGITVKDSPQNTLIFVTRLDTGAPVQGANVSIVRLDNRVFWRGTTGADGTALAPDTPLRDPDDWWRFSFVVMAEKDGDVAYVGSDWNEGIGPWDFGTGVNLRQAGPLLRGSVFTDRGVYRLGEDVHVKAILRHNGPAGIGLLPAGTPVVITTRDPQNRLVDERTVKLSAWSSAEWTMPLPPDGALGNYSMRAILEADRPRPKRPEERDPARGSPGPDEDAYVSYEKTVHGSFLVAAYRRPDFRVDVTLTGATALAGDPLNGTVTARYLFGAPMGARPVSWKFTRARMFTAPKAVLEKFGDDRWQFVGWGGEDDRQENPTVRSDDTKLGRTGSLALALQTPRDAGVPYTYTLEGDVEDVSLQHIAGRASLLVHPAPWYVGVRRPGYFTDQKAGLKTEIVAAALDGTAVAGVPVDVTLTRVQWQSVRRAEGNGFYTWESQRRNVPAGNWKIITAADPVPLSAPLQEGGYYILEATGRAPDGRAAVTRAAFYVLGDGYTAWARHDHNRIDLVPERATWKPGETARIMIQSPWEQATALVTTEREGIRSRRQFALTSTQQSIAVPITEADIPNVFVSVLLVKGRTKVAAQAGGSAADTEDSSDPGKPSFRLGYAELEVEDATKRLAVTLGADKQEYRPANAATVQVEVKDHQGRGSTSEVTLWAVDYGVLSLTAFRTPDVLGSVYAEKALQVFNADNRQRIVSRRVLTPKGASEGGGGGADSGAGTLRKDFRVLAFWLGSVTTDTDGRARVNVTLPESLTTYRIMAVAADRASRFGSAERDVRVTKPLTLKPTYPRFLAVGDRAQFGAVITNQLPAGGTATVAIRSLDPAVLEIVGAARHSLTVGPGGSLEARFEAAGRTIGRARVQMTVTLGDESDAFEDAIPVEVLTSPETVAAAGEASDASASEMLAVPRDVVPGFGGLHLELSSTAMVGLGEGARYLVEYPYGCAEQQGSRALALLLAADLGDAFSLPGLDTPKMRPAAQQALKGLGRFQCGNGGFATWPGACWSTSPYLTAYLLDVLKAAADVNYEVDAGVRERAYDYLEGQLAQPQPEEQGWWPSYTAWQAFAVKVLAEGGRNQDSNLTRLYGYRDRMPVFALAYLHDALLARARGAGPQGGPDQARIAELRRRLSNAIVADAGGAHVEELNDPYLLWFWNSNVRSTAIVLESLSAAGVPDLPARQLVRWLMAARRNGRWGNTQENAHAMRALVAYYRRFETVVPDFRAVVTLGAETLVSERFQGRTTTMASTDLPMSQFMARAQPGATVPLTFTRDGAGTLFFTARLRYAADALYQQGLDAGIAIERAYAPFVESGSRPPATTFKAGDLVQVTLTLTLAAERRYVAVRDPLPAGFEAVESWFATTSRTLAADQNRGTAEGDWLSWWRLGGFDRVERHDDRVQLFATRLAEGRHQFSYVVRATTSGTFRTAPAHAEAMYEPEIFGRTATATIEVKR